ncbi:MAG: RNA polymerase sigma factor [Devosia sp.]
MTTDALPHRETQRAIEAVFRLEQAKLIAGLTRIVRDVGMAEELAQDALIVALKTWPDSGVPRNPGAWLMRTAKRRAIDYFRRNKMAARKLEELGHDLREEEETPPDYDTALDDDVGDDLLKLIFTSCHPAISPEARVALTLRLLGGLTTDEIARAFLAAEPTIAQRIVRAKKNLAEAGLPFEIPEAAERAERLASVLEVLYLIFNEGYSATAGDDWTRPQLCEEAMRLGRILARLMPGEAEAHGLVALMEIQASRLDARTGPNGEPVLLLDQNRARWDQLLIRRGLNALAEAEALGAYGPYALQAGIAACHARAKRAEDTDWARIAGLYDTLAVVTPNPVIELNRAVAHAMAFGPQVGLDLLDANVAGHPALAGYHLLPSVRGDFLLKLGRREEARAAFEEAAGLTRNERERHFLLGRAAEAAA